MNFVIHLLTTPANVIYVHQRATDYPVLGAVMRVYCLFFSMLLFVKH
jgi:hypothetical protein